MPVNKIPKNHILSLISVLLLSIQSAEAACQRSRAPQYAIMAACAATALYYWFTPDTSAKRLNQLNIITFLPISAPDQPVAESTDAILAVLKKKEGIIRVDNDLYKIHAGIPETINVHSDPVSVYAGGYSNAGKPYAYCVYTALKAGIIKGPCVVFNYATDTRRAFNFCQEQDLQCLDIVCKDLVLKHPESKIILIGACKGAANNLRFLAEASNTGTLMPNIKAVIAESPPISAYDALKNQPFGRLSHFLTRFVLPNYRPATLKTIMDAQVFTQTVPVLVASLPCDTVSTIPEMNGMVAHLRAKGAQVEHFVCDSQANNIPHGKIGQARDYQQKVQDFLRRLNLRT